MSPNTVRNGSVAGTVFQNSALHTRHFNSQFSIEKPIKEQGKTLSPEHCLQATVVSNNSNFVTMFNITPHPNKMDDRTLVKPSHQCNALPPFYYR